MHSLGNYAFAIGLFALGLNVWGILAAFALASVLLFLLLTLSGFMGHKTGVPFPVMSRIAFGIKGAKIPAAVRGAVAIAWFGIQTYLASAVLSALLVAMFPSWPPWTRTPCSASPRSAGSPSWCCGPSRCSSSATGCR